MKVAATIVTYNRLISLKECIDALQNQSVKPDIIIIINNGSTDGTLEWLHSQTDLYTVTQENTGSGGGQFRALKTAYELGYDWVWTMDDDGVPDVDALKVLLESIRENSAIRVINSLVLNRIDHRLIAFGFDWKTNFYKRVKGEKFLSYSDLINRVGNDKVVIGIPQFFNSSLISKEVIRQAGLPISDLFIRGDELEYIYRIEKAGFKTYTAVDSIMFHPHPEYQSTSFLGFKINYEKMNGFKKYYAVRNRILIESHYFNSPVITPVKWIFKEVLYLILNYKRCSVIEELKLLLRIIRSLYSFKLSEEIEKSKSVLI